MENKTIGKLCAEFRRSLHITQKTVAEELTYSVENISAFENGRNANMYILLWYIRKGLLDWRGENEDRQIHNDSVE